MEKQSHKADIVAVAKAARVSISTVSRSFNHPDLVKPATRKKIDRAVEKLGYIRNRAAQAMHGRRSGTIGLVVPTIDHAIFAEVIQSFSDELDAAGFTILMATHGFDLGREYAVLRKLLEHRVDGVALIGLDHTEATYQLIEQQGIPAIAVWNYDAASRIPCVGAENALAGRMAAEHLVALGHRDIAVVFPQTLDNDRARDRLTGALGVLQAARIEVPAHWRSEAPYLIGEAKRVCAQILALPRRPTAILCGNDVIAQGAIYAAQRAGLAVPRDISIIGIGDFKGSGEIEPALTTIRIPAKSIGSIAGRQIVQSVAGETEAMVRERCELRLLVRETTASVQGRIHQG